MKETGKHFMPVKKLFITKRATVVLKLLLQYDIEVNSN